MQAFKSVLNLPVSKGGGQGNLGLSNEFQLLAV